MARVPLLISPEELKAYQYLRTPAIVMRGEDEEVMSAIERLRRDKVNVKTRTSQAWDQYQASLYQQNRIALLEAMRYAE